MHRWVASSSVFGSVLHRCSCRRNLRLHTRLLLRLHSWLDPRLDRTLARLSVGVTRPILTSARFTLKWDCSGRSDGTHRAQGGAWPSVGAFNSQSRSLNRLLVFEETLLASGQSSGLSL
jgi:hypothetical protein